MSFDWNWFFSSFCQSAAALIGIIAAFVISRLLGLGERINSVLTVFTNLRIDCMRVQESLSHRRFYWYNHTNVRYDDDIKKEIQNGDYESLNEQQILEKIYDSDSRLFKHDEAVLEAFNELYKKHKPEPPIPAGGTMFINRMKPLDIDFAPDGTWPRITQEGDRINQLKVEAKTLIRHLIQNRNDLDGFKDSSRQLKIIIILLMVSFPLTVIYPLHFMPVPGNQDPILVFNILSIIKSIFTFKSLLLIIFLATIEGIFYYFLLLINRIQKSLEAAIGEHTDEYLLIESYSPHFWPENQQV